MRKDNSPFKTKRSKDEKKKQNTLDLRLHVQVGEGPKPVALSGATLNDGWYVYSGNKSKNSNNGIVTNFIYLNKPPLAGLKLYLSSYYFQGIGPKVVDTICDAVGMKIIAILKNGSPSSVLHSVVNAKIIKSLKVGWENSKEIAIGYIFMSELGLTATQRRFIIDQYGSTIITCLNKFPFDTLIKIPRLNFTETETILKRINIEVSEEQFILGTANFKLLQSERSYGNTCAPLATLISGVSELTDINKNKIQQILEANEKKFDWFNIENSNFIQSRRSKERDEKIKTEFQRINIEFQRIGSNKNFVRSELKTWDNLKLSDEQLSAVNTSVNEAISVITGGPGAGKTTMVIGLVSALQSVQQKVKICAPTGRAAKKIKENPFLKKFDPSTIHRFLGKMNASDETDFDVMIVDEASMIDIDLLLLLLENIPDGASLVFIGDPDQLPSVGPGQIFKDIINSGSIAVSRLTGNFRQTEFSDIIKAARGINQGNLLDYSNSIQESDFAFIEARNEHVADRVIASYFEDLPNKLSDHDQSEFQILSPMRRHSAGIENLNKVIQTKLSRGKNPIFEKVFGKMERKFFSGDKVIMTKNNYDLGVMNGDVGIITGKENDNYLVKFEDTKINFSELELRSLELAYAISIHKSQGSEYSGVIIPITMEHSFMLSRNLIYTAITRGKQQVILIGQRECLRKAIARVMKDRRYTGLEQSLKAS